MKVMGYSLFLDTVEARPSVTSISVHLHIEDTIQPALLNLIDTRDTFPPEIECRGTRREEWRHEHNTRGVLRPGGARHCHAVGRPTGLAAGPTKHRRCGAYRRHRPRRRGHQRAGA